MFELSSTEARNTSLDYDTILEPSIFWFWNGDASHDSIRHRLDEFLGKGLKAVHVHPMPDYFRLSHFQQGMQVPYLSDAFFDLIAFTCEQMRQRGMLLWLYDEGGWPSGVAGGSVVGTDSNYGLWALEMQGKNIVPVQPFMKEAYPDLMNPEATQCFIEHTHEKYRRYIGSEFGGTVRGIFTDEPRLPGRLGTNMIPWSPLLPEAYARQHGHSLNKVLPTLFLPDPIDKKVALIRRDYMSTVSALIAENYYGVIRQWCERWGLLFEGHHSGEDEFGKHGQFFGDFLQQARQYHIPGIDSIWRQLFPEKNSGNYVSLASSISWLRGERCALSESFNVYGPGLTLQQMQWVTGFQIVRGVNKIAFMPSLDSTSETRWIGMGTDISPKTPVWRDFDLVVEFVRKAAKFSASGQVKAAVGVYYRSELVPEDLVADFDRLHEAICSHVHDSMAGLVFLGAEELESGYVEEGRLTVGAIQLSAVIVHVDGPLSAEEEQLLQNLSQQGLLVWHVAQDGAYGCDAELPEAAQDSTRWTTDFHEIDLVEYCPLTIDGPQKGVRLLFMEEQGQISLLFFNENLHPVRFSFSLRDFAVDSVLEEVKLDGDLVSVLNPLSPTPSGYSLFMHPGQMRAFRSVSRTELVNEPIWKVETSRQLELDWDIEEDERYLIGDDIHVETAYDNMRAGQLGDYSVQHPDFSGSLCYHTGFAQTAPQEGQRILLNLGDVYYSAEVFINGQSCGRRAWGPYIFDITSALAEGRNEMTIRVTNTLANQWVWNDANSEELPVEGNPYLERTSEFIDDSLHAGLAGPVTLQLLSH